MSVGQWPKSSDSLLEVKLSGHGTSSGKNASHSPQARAMKCRKPLFNQYSTLANSWMHSQEHQQESNKSKDASERGWLAPYRLSSGLLIADCKTLPPSSKQCPVEELYPPSPCPL